MELDIEEIFNLAHHVKFQKLIDRAHVCLGHNVPVGEPGCSTDQISIVHMVRRKIHPIMFQAGPTRLRERTPNFIQVHTPVSRSEVQALAEARKRCKLSCIRITWFTQCNDRVHGHS